MEFRSKTLPPAFRSFVNDVLALVAVMIALPVIFGLQANPNGIFFRGWGAMQVNGACGLAAAAMALFLRSRSPKASLSFSAFVSLIGGLTAFEYSAGIDLHIDRLLLRESLSGFSFPSPGRMALITAISLFLVGLAQVLQHQKKTEGFRFIFGAFLGTLPLSLGISTFLCHLLELESGAQMSSFARMAPATSVGICVLGILGLRSCIVDLRSNSGVSYRILPLVAFTMLSSIAVLSWQAALGFENKNQADAISSLVSGKQESVIEKLNQTTDAVRRYAARIAVVGLGNRLYLQTDSQNYLDQLKVIARLGVVDQRLKVLWSFPEELHHQVSGFSQAAEPLRKAAFDLAASTHHSVMSQTIELKSGGAGSLIVIPPFRSGKEFRSIYATVNTSLLFENLFSPRDFFVKISEGGKTVFYQDAQSNVVESVGITSVIPFGLMKWEIRVVPTSSYLKAHSSDLPHTILFFGELLALIVTALAWISFRASHEKTEFNRFEAENLDRLNIALESSNIAAWSLDMKTGAVWRSKSHDLLFGYEDALPEWSQEIFYSHVHRDDIERVKKSQTELSDVDKSEIEFRIHPSGSLSMRWLKLVTRVARDEKGTPVRARGIVRDITAEKRAEIERLFELEWKKAVLNGAEYSIISTDKSGTILTFNRRAEELLGYCATEVVGKQSAAIFHDEKEVVARAEVLSKELRTEVRPGFDTLVAKTILRGVSDENDWTYISKFGKRIPVRLSVSVVRSADGSVQGYLGVAKDVSLELAAQREIRIAYDRLQRVVDSTGEGIWERSFVSKEIDFINEQGKRIFGFAEDYNPTYEEVRSRLHPDDMAPLQEILEKHVKERTPGFDFEFRLAQKNPGDPLKWVRSKGRVTFVNDCPDQLVSTLSDVTEAVNARLKLEQALRDSKVAMAAKSIFLASMSHEIRTPLNGIIGMTDLILDSSLSDDQRSYAEIVQQSGLSLLSLINDILDFSKIEAGKMDLEQNVIDLANVVENQIDILMVKAVQKNISLASFISPEVPSGVLGDAGRLGQILLNLIGNAIKFTSKGGVAVDVRFTSRGAVRFEVKDRGIGISKEGIANLFQPFSQADSSISNKFGGTGLGLSICKRLVEAMGGQIGVESEVGVGSNFWFEIPFALDGVKPSTRTEWESFRSARTLIVEPDSISSTALGNYLSFFQTRNETVADVEKVSSFLEKARIENDPYRVVFVSSALEKKSLFELSGNSKLVLLSDFTESVEKTSFEDGKFSALLKKPMKQSSLIAVLGELLGGVKQEQRVPPVLVKSAEESSAVCAMKKRVLVAEDVSGNQILVRKMLEKLGYSPTIVSNGLEVLDSLSKFPFDLIFMDCQMPEMDGFETTARIRASKVDAIRNIPIVALTANAMNGDAKRCIEGGMNDYMSKPMKLVQLGEMLEKWLGSKQELKAG